MVDGSHDKRDKRDEKGTRKSSDELAVM